MICGPRPSKTVQTRARTKTCQRLEEFQKTMTGSSIPIDIQTINTVTTALKWRRTCYKRNCCAWPLLDP